MMGATLPLWAKDVVDRNRQIGPRVGLLYGINTFAAVAGTLAAAFWLLPSLGLRRTTWVGAAEKPDQLLQNDPRCRADDIDLAAAIPGGHGLPGQSDRRRCRTGF
jgi:hypothetical protein